jgi:hypothetical protein
MNIQSSMTFNHVTLVDVIRSSFLVLKCECAVLSSTLMKTIHLVSPIRPPYILKRLNSARETLEKFSKYLPPMSILSLQTAIFAWLAREGPQWFQNPCSSATCSYVGNMWRHNDLYCVCHICSRLTIILFIQLLVKLFYYKICLILN